MRFAKVTLIDAVMPGNRTVNAKHDRIRFARQNRRTQRAFLPFNVHIRNIHNV